MESGERNNWYASGDIEKLRTQDNSLLLSRDITDIPGRMTKSREGHSLDEAPRNLVSYIRGVTLSARQLRSPRPKEVLSHVRTKPRHERIQRNTLKTQQRR